MSPADLMSVAVAFALGALIFVVGMRFGLFHLRAPAWFGVNFWYVAGARGFVAGCGAIQRTYESYLRWLPSVVKPTFFASVDHIVTVYQESAHSLKRKWRAVRGHAHDAWVRSGRRWHRLGVGLATRSPELRNERFLRSAAMVLARENQDCVRCAVENAGAWLRTEDADNAPPRSALLSDVRDIAAFMAEQVSRHRMDVLEDFARHGDIERVSDRFEQVVMAAHSSCDLVPSLSLDFGRRRLAGEDITDELTIATSGLLREEEFAQHLLDAATLPGHPSAAESRAMGATGLEIVVERVAGLPVSEWRAMGSGRLELAAGWVADIFRILAEASTHEHAELFSTRVDAATVIATRTRIQRYARDMSWNVAVILVVLLVLLVAIAVGM
jgi:hypothetical protein